MKLSSGPVTQHIKVSSGGESQPLKFYSTNYQVDYGRRWSHVEPRLGAHSGAGYVPNTRMFLAYRPGCDPENKRMGPLLADNYMTVTHKSFQNIRTPTGTEIFPAYTMYGNTGFVREGGTHSLPSKVIRHDKTHYRDNFQEWPNDPLRSRIDAKGPKCKSGFLSNQPMREPVTHTPGSNHSNMRPGWMTDRPLSSSCYKISYRPYSVPHGAETLPRTFVQSSGFTKGNCGQPDYTPKPGPNVYDRAENMSSPRLAKLKKSDPTEYDNAVNQGWHPTIYKGAYKGGMGDPPNLGEREKRGDKPGETGYTNNFEGYVQSRDDPRRHITQYMTAYHDPTPQGLDREGHLGWNVDTIQDDGFTRGTGLHCLEAQVDAFKMLRRLDPYQARSVAIRDYVTVAP